MRVSTLKLSAVALLAAATLLAAPAAMAVDLTAVVMKGKPGGSTGGGGGGGSSSEPGTSTCSSAVLTEVNRCWMTSDVGAAHSAGYKGQGTYVTFVDDFVSNDALQGYFGKGGSWGDGWSKLLTHGEWTSSETHLVAPSATIIEQDFSVRAALVAHSDGLDVVNASYGMMGIAPFYSSGSLASYPTEQSIIDAARTGTMIISKAAGNDGIAIGGTTADFLTDYLANELVGAQTAIFVGALDFNGTAGNVSGLSWYSNYPGNNKTVQNQFLVVGVDYNATGLAGTSFAAPIVAGYAAILGSKFTSATEVQVANQLLSTATREGLLDLGRSGWGSEEKAAYGRGQACLSCALSAASLN